MEKCGRVYGVSMENAGKCVGVWAEVWGKVYGVSVEVCWDVGRGEGRCGKRYGRCAEICIKEVCWGVGPLHTSSQTSHVSPHSNLSLHLLLPPPTPEHTSLHLSPHLPSPSQSVAKLPCGRVSGKLPQYVIA